MEQTNLLSLTNDSGVEGCSSIASGSGGTGQSITNGLHHHNHQQNHSPYQQYHNNSQARNSETTSAIDLSEMNLQEDIPHDDEVHSTCEQNSDIFELNDQNTTENCHMGNGNTKVLNNRMTSELDGARYEMDRDIGSSSSNILKHDNCDRQTEVDSDERDTFSPVNNSSCEENIVCRQINETTLKLGDNFTMTNIQNDGGNHHEDNNLFRRRKYDGNLKSSTKEEKQRQNEEIVILESSSISSETGSWEALFPSTQHEMKESCKTFLTKERNYCDNFNVSSSVSSSRTGLSGGGGDETVIDDEVDDDEEEVIIRKEEGPSAPNPSRVVSACFIDASSLLDENEFPSVPYLSFGAAAKSDVAVAPRSSSNTESSSHTPECPIEPTKENSEPEEDSDKDAWPKQKHLVKLDSFHTVFERCKSGSAVNTENPVKIEPAIEADERIPATENGDRMKQRQEFEKMQGGFIFKNSIQQFSGHLIDPKIPYSDDNFSDFSLQSQYSTQSETDGRHDDFKMESMEEPNSLLIFPDTPHNSIIQISAHNREKLDELKGGLIADVEKRSTPKRIQKCDESAPIVSGGASIKDFTPKQCESPTIRRKIDNCPIVSGGSMFSNYDTDQSAVEKPIEKTTNPKLSSSIASWVVDMSDCNNSIGNGRQCNGSSSTTSNEKSHAGDEDRSLMSLERSSSCASKNGSLGYFVDFDNLKSEGRGADESHVTTIKPRIETPKKFSTGFFVDLSDNECNSLSSNKTPSRSGGQSTPPSHQSTDSQSDKKNIFSMFIDFGDKKPVTKREPFSLTSKLSYSLSQKKSQRSPEGGTMWKSDCSSEVQSSDNDDGAPSPMNSLSKIDETKRMDAVVHRVGSGSSVTSKSAEIKRHSWNTSNPNAERSQEKSEAIDGRSADYKRSLSLSTDKNIMSILDKIPLISKTSSMSIDSSISPHDDFSSTTKSDLSIYSNNSANQKGEPKKRQRDVKINETYDKSSQGSITDGIFSKDSSPLSSTTETDDVTFQNDTTADKIVEEEVLPPTINYEIQRTNTAAHVGHTMESLQATIERQKKLLETVNENIESPPATLPSSNFVKLSDMDKPVPKFELHSNAEVMSNSVGSRVAKLFHEPKYNTKMSAYDKFSSWNMSRSTGTNVVNLATSVENTRSLSRLFPHLTKVFSNSVPSDVGYNSLEKSINEMSEYIISEMSFTSSVASSRSGFDSADESSISYRQPRRLGEDLLKMFLQEIGTDVTLEVGNRKMKAHKCILRSRCQYFAAILAGGWVQSAGNVIALPPGYSYDVVHFALCHIYSGAAHPPEGISLMELAGLSDLLGLEGLKEVTAYALKTNYCHNFHKPCSGCIEGIVQVLPVSLNHGLDDLYRKCLKWVCRHYVKVWPTRCFASLNYDLFSRCRQQITAHMNSENILNTFLECENLLITLAPCRWAKNVENLLRDLVEMSETYICDHFASLIASDSFLSLGHGNSWNISRLEHLLLRSASSLTPDQACKSYQRCTRLNTVLGAKVITMPSQNVDGTVELNRQEEMDWNEEFIRLVSAILSAVEQCLTRQCARAMKVNSWQRMDVELRKKIQQLACLSGPLERKSRSTLNKISYGSQSSNTMPTYNNRNQDLHQVRMAIQQANTNRRSASHDNNRAYRASATTQTNVVEPRVVAAQNPQFAIDKSVQANEQSVVRQQGGNVVMKSSSRTHVSEHLTRPKTVAAPTHKRSQSENLKLTKDKSATSVPKLAGIKPRYLEPKKNNLSRGNILKAPTKGNRLSSSESSTRTSSPAGRKSLSSKKINDSTISLDSLASPAKKSQVLTKSKTDAGCGGTEYSNDSLGDSMRSSTKTDRTTSHECLLIQNTNTAATQATKNLSKSNPMINKENRLTKIGSSTKVLAIATTNKNFPRGGDLASKKPTAISRTSAAISDNSPQPRRSFLSARSREILAKKNNNHNVAPPTNGGSTKPSSIPITKSSSASPVLTERRSLNKSSSSSCVPTTRRSYNPTPNQQRKSTTTTTTTRLNQTTKNELNQKNAIQFNNKKDMKKIDDEIIVEFVIPEEKINFESKLERSSTFCKETSDLPVNELQIIE